MLAIEGIGEFLDGVIASLDDEQFARHQAALVNEVLRPHKNLWERAEFYWQSIAKKQYEFDGRRQLADAIESLDREQWQAYFQKVFLEQRRSLQVAAPGKWGELPAGDQKRVKSALELRSGHDFYVIE